MTRLLFTNCCLLLLFGRVLRVAAEIPCAVRAGITEEGNDVAITSAVCYGDGSVGYGWETITMPGTDLNRIQIESSCYNSSEEHNGEGKVQREWGTASPEGSGNFIVENWFSNMTCILYGCYEVETTIKSRYLMSTVECSDHVPPPSSSSLPSSFLAVLPTSTSQFSTTETHETTQTLSATSPTSVVTMATTALSSTSPSQSGSSDENMAGEDSGDISAVYVAIFVAGIAVITVVVVLVCSFIACHTIRRKKQNQFKLDVINPVTCVDREVDLVNPANENILVDLDAMTLCESPYMVIFSESPQLKHSPKSAVISTVSDVTHILGHISLLGGGADENEQVPVDSDSTVTETGELCGDELPSLPETNRRPSRAEDAEEEGAIFDSATGSGNNDELSQDDQVLPFTSDLTSSPSTHRRNGCVTSDNSGYIVLNTHTNSGSHSGYFLK